MAVYNKGEFSTTFTYRDTDINSTFYGNTIYNNDDYFRFSQIGGLNSWDSLETRIFTNLLLDLIIAWLIISTIIMLFRVTVAFPNILMIRILILTTILDNDINYINVDDQYFYNYTSGINDKFNFQFCDPLQGNSLYGCINGFSPYQFLSKYGI